MKPNDALQRTKLDNLFRCIHGPLYPAAAKLSVMGDYWEKKRFRNRLPSAVIPQALTLFFLLATIHAGALDPTALQSGKHWSFETRTHGDMLRGRYWPASSIPKAVLVTIHGTQTHAGWFGAVAAEMNAHGWSVYAPDRRGSGLNLLTDAKHMPKPADADHWTDWVSDLDCVIGQILRDQERQHHKRPPVYLLGSSWGTALTSVYLDPAFTFRDGSKPAHASSIAGLILSVPSGLKSKVPNIAKQLEVGIIGGVLGRMIPPLRKRGTGIGLPAWTYSRDEQTRILIGERDIPLPQAELELKLGGQDPRMIHRATYDFMLQSGAMRKAANKALIRLHEQVPRFPVLVPLAAHDDIADNPWLQKHLPHHDGILMMPGTEHAVQLEHPALLAATVIRWAAH